MVRDNHGHYTHTALFDHKTQLNPGLVSYHQLSALCKILTEINTSSYQQSLCGMLAPIMRCVEIEERGFF
ncbi:hypothetical protein AAJ76_700006610 [Vairimorpha ceranae]|uniref:Uncharacterized protein n=1 Tax=Vairimorpha ceranae TaxID=40302 RepID=A0A0F9WA16_9MICR|nr:hypothetical protein AAJ76_700006610 [Vairimorpha ceranae]KKO74451.1 hypothetical protein AAJ76_700006610 [Vairimorpha ceranae]